MKKKKVKVIKNLPSAKVAPTYNPDTVIDVRKYGVKDLENHIEKIKKNIKIFEEAIEKEMALMKRDNDMIKVLKKDIEEAKMFKKLKRLKN
jgi:hypothetical protein